MQKTNAGQTLPQFGPCCACGQDNGHVRNILLLHRRAPQPGAGWGCFACGLPMDGAIALVCDRCLETRQELRFVVDGQLAGAQRIAIADFPDQPFTHDLSRHPGLGQNNN